LARYVVFNPIRAQGMIRKLEKWPWSSYLAMINQAEKNSGLTTDWVLSQFIGSPRQARNRYQKFVHKGINQKIDIWTELKN